MNPRSRILWSAISELHARENQWEFWHWLLLGQRSLCLRTLAAFTPEVVFIEYLFCKAIYSFLYWVFPPYKVYLCIIFNWYLFLLKFPSLLLYLDCIQGNVKDFSSNYSSLALSIALLVSLQSLAAEHEIMLLSKTWWLPHKRILDYISFTYLFIH